MIVGKEIVGVAGGNVGNELIVAPTKQTSSLVNKSGKNAETIILNRFINDAAKKKLNIQSQLTENQQNNTYNNTNMEQIFQIVDGDTVEEHVEDMVILVQANDGEEEESEIFLKTTVLNDNIYEENIVLDD